MSPLRPLSSGVAWPDLFPLRSFWQLCGDRIERIETEVRNLLQ